MLVSVRMTLVLVFSSVTSVALASVLILVSVLVLALVTVSIQYSFTVNRVAPNILRRFLNPATRATGSAGGYDVCASLSPL